MSEVIDEGVAAALSDGDDAIRIFLPQGVAVTAATAQAAAARFGELAGEAARPAILNLTGVGSISREAREILCRMEGAAAIALVGQSPVDRVIANFVLGADPLPCPAGFFTSEPLALAWLEHVRAG